VKTVPEMTYNVSSGKLNSTLLCSLFVTFILFCMVLSWTAIYAVFARPLAFRYRPMAYQSEGLNTVRYKLVEHQARPLYTWLYLALPPHPSYFTASAAHRCQTCNEHLEFLVTLLVTYVYIRDLHGNGDSGITAISSGNLRQQK